MKKIAILIAYYNGKKYIEKQLESLSQLSNIKNNEINTYIINDYSNEGNYIEKIITKKLNFSSNICNIGHVKTFEKLLTKKTEDYLFFCDQDDYWIQNKIEKIVEIFENNPKIILIHHELNYVNHELTDLNRPKRKINFGLQNRITFLLRQFYKPELFGCAIAIRSSLARDALPFPKSAYAHDHWLSVIAPFHGDVYMSPLQLVKYRQHSNNLTPKKKNTMFQIIKFRFLFLNMIIIATYRKLFVHVR